RKKWAGRGRVHGREPLLRTVSDAQRSSGYLSCQFHPPPVTMCTVSGGRFPSVCDHAVTTNGGCGPLSPAARARPPPHVRPCPNPSAKSGLVRIVQTFGQNDHFQPCEHPGVRSLNSPGGSSVQDLDGFGQGKRRSPALPWPPAWIRLAVAFV